MQECGQPPADIVGEMVSMQGKRITANIGKYLFLGVS